MRWRSSVSMEMNDGPFPRLDDAVDRVVRLYRDRS